jgi:pimeloyl-ACP methyl ester carboxylesterase
MILHEERRGSGRPLLMVHGLGGSTRSWDTILPQLAATREVVLIDLPGHGRSPAIEGAPDHRRPRRRGRRSHRARDLHGVDLVGSSVGPRLALELSRRGVGRHCVALAPGGFWRGWETRWFSTTIAASIRLVRWLQPQWPSCPATPPPVHCC